jgi:hypothetical protein
VIADLIIYSRLCLLRHPIMDVISASSQLNLLPDVAKIDTQIFYHTSFNTLNKFDERVTTLNDMIFTIIPTIIYIIIFSVQNSALLSSNVNAENVRSIYREN